jgi:hypothetical protein
LIVSSELILCFFWFPLPTHFVCNNWLIFVFNFHFRLRAASLYAF